MDAVIFELILFGIFLALSAADWALTRIILGGGGVEVNPIMRLAYKSFGMTGIAGIKALIAALVVQWQMNGTLPNWAMFVCIAAYALTVAHLAREVNKIDSESRKQTVARLIDPRKFSVLQWAGLAMLIFGPVSILLVWETATAREFQLISSFVMMAAITFFATFVYYPKIGDSADPSQWNQ